MVIDTTELLSEQFPYNEDMNSGLPLGIGACISHKSAFDHINSLLT